MRDFIQFVNKLSQLDNETTETLIGALKTRTFNKGEYLLKSSEICRHIFFIDQGLTKTFFNKEDKEFIMKFFVEGSMFTVLDSYIQQSPSTFMILALEPTTITYINYNDLEELCERYHQLETFLRKLVSIASLNMMKRISEMLEENATNRYYNFINENKDLSQRISLGDLACYLGITQVSLSRIRSKK